MGRILSTRDKVSEANIQWGFLLGGIGTYKMDTKLILGNAVF